MLRTLLLSNLLLGFAFCLHAQEASIRDDFEGNGNISTWAEDNCRLNLGLPNPFSGAYNPSSKVLEYHDVGGQYANIRFDISGTFDLSESHAFSVKIYVPSAGLTGNAPLQLSLKLQNSTLSLPWTTQSEIIKPIVLDQWQTLTFDFENDNYININPSSLPPTQRNDFNRVLFQVNGENNNHQVLAYLDDVNYDGLTQSGGPSGGGAQQGDDPVYDQLVWSDEFDGNGALDDSKWFHQTRLPNNGSWFNSEIQHYTDRVVNSYQDNGIMHLVAKRETFTDQGETKQFTSARLNSKFAFTYGRVEVRAVMPFGPGTWPAIWLLGKNISEIGAYWQTQGFGTTPWPDCGEIDIMEHWGTNQSYVSSAIHTPSSYGGTVNVGAQNIPTVSTAYHVYSLDWYPDRMVFAVDGNVHYVYEPAVRNASTWPFDKPQYLILNVAILPSILSTFTLSDMEVDYVRVYQESNATRIEAPAAPEFACYPNPFEERFTLELPHSNQLKLDVQLLDNMGRLLHTLSAPIENNKVVLDTWEELPKGIYLLSFDWKGKAETLRVIKK